MILISLYKAYYPNKISKMLMPNYFARFVGDLLRKILIANFINNVIHVIHMKKELITVRNVDEDVWRKFKAKTVEERLRTGEALTEAMKKWVKEKEKKETKPNPRLLLKIKPFKWGKGKKKVRWSEEIDEILYGKGA